MVRLLLRFVVVEEGEVFYFLQIIELNWLKHLEIVFLDFKFDFWGFEIGVLKVGGLKWI